jgi:hypothetical protein
MISTDNALTYLHGQRFVYCAIFIYSLSDPISSDYAVMRNNLIATRVYFLLLLKNISGKLIASYKSF